MGSKPCCTIVYSKKSTTFLASGRDEQARRLLMEVQSRSIALHDEVNLLQTRLKTLEEAMRLSCSLFRRNGWRGSEQDINLGPFLPALLRPRGRAYPPATWGASLAPTATRLLRALLTLRMRTAEATGELPRAPALSPLPTSFGPLQREALIMPRANNLVLINLRLQPNCNRVFIKFTAQFSCAYTQRI